MIPKVEVLGREKLSRKEWKTIKDELHFLELFMWDVKRMVYFAGPDNRVHLLAVFF